MFEKLETPEQIFSHKLGSALKMEEKVLQMLGDLQQHAQRSELKQLFEQHEQETREHVERIEKSFALLGEEVDDSSSPAIEGLEKEGKATIKMTEDRIVDIVLLDAAAATEHHEISVYETLVTNADARGATEVADLLRRNLEQEEEMLEEVKEMAKRLAREGIAV